MRNPEGIRVGRNTGLKVVMTILPLFAWTTLPRCLAQQPGSPPPAETTEAPDSSVFHRGIEPHEDAPAPPATAPTPAMLQPIPKPLPGELTETEQRIARQAWQYLAANQQKDTGLFNSVWGYPRATMWDIASALAAVVAAEKLHVIPRTSFLNQMRQILESLARMPLYNHELPNREYDIRTLGLLDARSQPSIQGSGWSAIDLGRLLIWLKIIAQWYPELTDPVEKLVGGWHFTRLVKEDEMHGALLTGGRELLRQEGRLGYEEYAASGLAVWGVRLKKPFQQAHAETFSVFDVLLLRDTRKPAFLTSEPFFLTRMEVGSINPRFESLGNAIYDAQRLRWEREGILTAVSEDSVSYEPWFVYNTLAYEGKPWACVSVSGKEHENLKSVSTKGAMAWWAVQDDHYSERLFEAVKDLVDPSSGFFAGIYEDGKRNLSRNLNTNAVVLEAILYRQLGRRPFLEVTAANQGTNTTPPKE